MRPSVRRPLDAQRDALFAQRKPAFAGGQVGGQARRDRQPRRRGADAALCLAIEESTLGGLNGVGTSAENADLSLLSSQHQRIAQHFGTLLSVKVYADLNWN